MKKILCIDDSTVILTQLKKTLVAEGFTVLEAYNGSEGLNVLNQNPDVSLVICDLYMPIMNGLETLEEIKKLDQFKELPVLMMSTEGGEEQVKRAQDLGATGWFVKPFDGDDLLSAVDLLVSNG